jgi:hypothetical protein
MNFWTYEISDYENWKEIVDGDISVRNYSLVHFRQCPGVTTENEANGSLKDAHLDRLGCQTIFHHWVKLPEALNVLKETIYFLS